MVSKKLTKKILNAYFNLWFLGSYQGIPVFRKSLQEKLGITISHRALQRLLKSSLHYQVNVTKAKRFKRRPFYSRGVGIEAFTDTVFVSLKDEENTYRRFIFQVVVDVHSRMCYATKIDGTVSAKSLREAYIRLFKQGMPKYSIIRCDRDPAVNALATTYFANQGILLRARRATVHMAFLEGVIRGLKRKLIQNLRKNKPRSGWTDKKLEVALKDLVHSYNNTVSSSHGRTPISVNSPKFDPFLRDKLYGTQRIESFEQFFKEQMKLRKKANTPDNKEDGPNFNEQKNKFKVGSLVYIDYSDDYQVSQKYNVKHGAIYEISEVNTFQRPFIYKLKDVHTEKPIHGWYYGRELSRANLTTNLKVEEVLKRKRLKNGKTVIYCKFKGLDSSFNRWLKEGEEQ